MAGNLERSRPRTSTTFVSRFRFDVDTGIFLQRDLFYLRPGARAVLRRSGTQRWSLHSAVRARQFSRSARARTFVRYDWPENNDLCDLRDLGDLAGAEWLVIS